MTDASGEMSIRPRVLQRYSHATVTRPERQTRRSITKNFRAQTGKWYSIRSMQYSRRPATSRGSSAQRNTQSNSQTMAATCTTASKSFILTGLPTWSSLDWAESCLRRPDKPECCFCSLAHYQHPDDENKRRKWRKVPFSSGGDAGHGHGDHEEGRCTQLPASSSPTNLPLLYEGGGSYVRYSGGSFEGFATLTSDDDDESRTQELYSASLAATVASAAQQEIDLSSSDGLDNDANDAGFTLTSTALPRPLPGEYTSLSCLSHFFPAIDPTISPTANLIVGIIKVLPRRTMRTRLGRDADLIEVLLGDDTVGTTAPVLKLNCWLELDDKHKAGQSPSKSTSPVGKLLRLRSRELQSSISPFSNFHRGDVIYLRGVSLHTYRGVVYASLLRNNMTKIDLYFRLNYSLTSSRGAARCSEPGRYTAEMLSEARKLTGEDFENLHPHVRKTLAVRDWIVRAFDDGESIDAAEGSVLPADTQW
ncbi:hypothetical protein KEM56_005720 [Ascosphaera pollenicola]|nr:hypothetical protein KEM56_005720 [Ascosphaera pollenicola]